MSKEVMVEESLPIIIFGYVKRGHGRGLPSNYNSLVMSKKATVEDSFPIIIIHFCQKEVIVEESL